MGNVRTAGNRAGGSKTAFSYHYFFQLVVPEIYPGSDRLVALPEQWFYIVNPSAESKLGRCFRNYTYRISNPDQRLLLRIKIKQNPGFISIVNREDCLSLLQVEMERILQIRN